MNGLMQRYNESLKNMSEPINLSQIRTIKMDLRGLLRYADEKGVAVIELSESEKAPFIKQ